MRRGGRHGGRLPAGNGVQGLQFGKVAIAAAMVEPVTHEEDVLFELQNGIVRPERAFPPETLVHQDDTDHFGGSHLFQKDPARLRQGASGVGDVVEQENPAAAHADRIGPPIHPGRPAGRPAVAVGLDSEEIEDQTGFQTAHEVGGEDQGAAQDGDHGEIPPRQAFPQPGGQCIEPAFQRLPVEDRPGPKSLHRVILRGASARPAACRSLLTRDPVPGTVEVRNPLDPSPEPRSPVLVVEDDADYRELVCACLEADGFTVIAVDNGWAAVHRLSTETYSAVVADIRMPGMNGVDLLRYVRLYQQDLPFLLLTGVNDVTTAVKSMQQGADHYLLKPFPPGELGGKIREAQEQRSHEADRERRARRADTEGLIGFLRGVRSLVITLEMKDRYTRDHSRKVAQATVLMARRIPGMDRPTLRQIRVGALLHDVGKIGVPQEILQKTGPLDSGEWEIIKQHPEYGHRILQPLARSYPEVQRIVRHEHERWDGKGYPDGLAGKEIPMGSRLIMIADTYDAICSTRSYRKAMSKDAALKVMREGAGSQFDPDLVPVFEEVFDDLPAPRP